MKTGLKGRDLTRRPSVVVIGRRDGHFPPGLGVLRDRVVVHHVDTAPELVGVIRSADAALLWDVGSPLLRQHYERARDLQWVHVGGAGVDAVMSPEIAASDVVVTNARGVFSRPIAETVVAMMLLFAKDLLTTIELQSRRRWLHRETEMLAGQAALVVGAGDIGRAISRAISGLGVDVTGVATSERYDQDLGLVRSVDALDYLLPRADFVVLALPLTDRSRGIIGTRQLGLMKETARLINVGRGQLVNEDALVAALRSGSIAGAALDVFRTEPLTPASPLWAMPNVVVSPHMSADFRGRFQALADQFIDNLDRWLCNQPLLNVVDMTLGYIPGNPTPGA